MEIYSLSAVEIAYCVVVLLIAYGLRGSTGFGGAVGMPLMALVIPMKVLVPAWTLLGIASSIAILGHDRRHVSVRSVIAFLPWCLLGIAIGLYFFKTLDARTLARGLGVLVLSYAAYTLSLTMRPPSARRLPAGIVGPIGSAVSGVVGTLFGTMSTLFFVIFLDTRGLAKDAFRATLSAMLLTLSVVRGAGYLMVGEFSREAWLLFAVALPVMLLGIYVGNRIHVKLAESTFRRVVVLTLLVSGVPLLLR